MGIRDDGVKRYNVHSENKFFFAQEIKIANNLKCVLTARSLTHNGKDLTIGAIILSK